MYKNCMGTDYHQQAEDDNFKMKSFHVDWCSTFQINENYYKWLQKLVASFVAAGLRGTQAEWEQ